MEPAEPLDVGDHSALLLRWVFSACLTGEPAVSGELDYHGQKKKIAMEVKPGQTSIIEKDTRSPRNIALNRIKLPVPTIVATPSAAHQLIKTYQPLVRLCQKPVKSSTFQEIKAGFQLENL
jgi:hypothetical protein